MYKFLHRGKEWGKVKATICLQCHKSFTGMIGEKYQGLLLLWNKSMSIPHSCQVEE